MRIMAILSAFAGAVGLNCCDRTAGPPDPAPDPQPRVVCQSTDSARVSHLGRMSCPTDWDSLKGPPSNAVYGRATSVKIIQSIASGQIWFPNSTRYPMHWDFASTVLGYPTSAYQTTWNDNYSDAPKRQYVLATITHYEGPDLWVVQVFPGDDLSSDRLAKLMKTAADSTWIGQKLVYLPANDSAAARAVRARVPMVSANAVFRGESFQCLNTGIAYGTLVRADHDTVGNGRFSPRDIVLTDGLPNDLPTVAGVITTEFQTPLSHLNVLSRNRGTPNMALRTAWTDPVFTALAGKSVRLEVTLAGWKLREATTAEVDSFWKAHVLPVPPELPLDTTPGLVGLTDLNRLALPRVGSKAANFGELARIASSYKNLFKVPEGGFAIPFAAYLDHIRKNNITPAIDSLLADGTLLENATARRAALLALQDRILQAPVDSALLADITSAIRANAQYTRMRFRSSTNAEDLAEFNGAGLYSSYTGDLDNPKKPIDVALRKTWASLWNERAFLERSAYRIDQHRVAMGVLVHRSFPDEGVNGVALTRNIYQPEYFGYVINAQQGEVSVVDPPQGTVSEQWIYYPFPDGTLGDPTLELVARGTLDGGAAVLTEAEVVRLGKALEPIQFDFCAMLGGNLREAYRYGLDVEFKLDGTTRTLYIKQARPLP